MYFLAARLNHLSDHKESCAQKCCGLHGNVLLAKLDGDTGPFQIPSRHLETNGGFYVLEVICTKESVSMECCASFVQDSNKHLHLEGQRRAERTSKRI